MIFRPAADADLERLMPLLTSDPYDTLRPDVFWKRRENGEYRTEWTWLAEENAHGLPAAAAVWWGRPEESAPAALDGLFARAPVDPADRLSLTAGLLSAAHLVFAQAGARQPPAYHFFLPADWHEMPGATAAVAWREEAARQAGLTRRLERLRFEWTTRDGLPGPGRRLVFRAEADDDVFEDLFCRVLAGTLDATSRNEAAAHGARAQARRDLRFYRDKMLGQRSWWRVAQTPDGEIAGFGLPSRNTDYPVVGYLGVLPEHRGHGYADEILADITRTLVAEASATVIHADTDLENRPMAAAFERAGYRTIGRRLVLSAG
jgi:RimJ/RimL family protein N-acetyltransferase